MVTFLITSFFILALLAIAIYFWQKPASRVQAEMLPPAPGRGLFVDAPEYDAQKVLIEAGTAAEASAAKRKELIARAQAGEKSALLEASDTKDTDLYEEVLNLLVAGAENDAQLLSLVSYVTRQELRVNKKLAERMIDSYKLAPDRGSTAKMLHIAALSDDAAVYQSAVEAALSFWRNGQLPEVSAQELRSILEGEFWILSSPTRSSGAGFLLKKALADARRELEVARK